MDTPFKVGSILVNPRKEYTKVISYKRGIYGLSGWTTRVGAEKATVATKFQNKHGLRYANARVVKGGVKAEAKSPAKPKGKKAPATKSKVTSKASVKKASKPRKTTTKKKPAKKKS